MKVLFAVNDEKDAESITRVYQEEYKEIISSKTVYYFNAIIKELQKDKTYDRIVISEDLEMFSNNNYQAIDKFIFEKMDAISDEATNAEGNDIPIILLCVDRRTKNDPLLLKLFGLGLYNILVGQDRSVQKVCKLMYKPRTKKEAKLYYKVEAENVNYTATNRSTGVNESEMQNILNHYKKIGDNIPKCVQSFESIASQYSKEQIKLIIQVLPVNVKVILEENSDLYRKIMGIHGKKVLGASQLRKTDYVEKEIDTGSRLTKPVIIPTAVSTKKVTKIQSPEELKRKQERMARERAEAEERRKEQERIAREKAEAEARRKEQERIARERAEAEERRKEQERIAREKAEAEARRKEQERIARERAEAEERRKEQERIAREKAEAEARRKEQERIEREKAEAEARRKEQERIAREKAEAEARRKEQERIEREKAEAEARRKEQERIEREKAEAEERRKEQERIEKEKAEEEMKEEVNVQNVKRGRGRPRKNPVPVIVEEVPVKKKRGRPRKNPIIEEEAVEEKVQEPKKEVLSKNKKYNQNNENSEKNDKLINPEIYDDDDLLNKEISEDDDILSQFDDYDEEDNKENIDYDQLDNEDDLDYDELDNNDLNYDELDEDELEDYDDTDYDKLDEYDDTDYNELDDDTDYDESKEQYDQDYDEDGDMLPEFEDYEEEDNKSNVKTNNLEDDKDTTLPGFDEDDDYSDDELLDDENDNYYDDYNDDDYDEDEELLDLDDEEDDETELPGLDDDEEDDETELSGLDDDEEDDETELPGLDDDEEDDETELPGLDDDEEDDETELPGLDDDEEDDETELPGLDDEEDDDETELPGFDDEDNEIQLEEPVMEKQHNGSFKKINNKNYKYDNNLANSIKDLQETEENTSYNIDTDNLITSDQKIVSFVGTTKNGTSFIVNNLAELYSNKGIKTAILDLTKNKNSYYIYTNNEDELRETAHDCLEKLRTGIADGIKVNKNLSIFTSLPGEDDSLDDVTNIIQTLLENYTIVLLDCDFATDVRYFKASQEIYLVQSLDVLTIQPLTAFLRELKLKGILETNKLRIIINKNVRVNSVTDKILIGGMSVYNDPGMTYMTELFDRDTIKYTTLPFDDQVYVKYLEGLVNCRISSKGYSKNFMSSLNKLSDMVYPTISGKKAKNKYNIYSNKNSKFEEKFSENTNSTLDKMRKKY